jgi:murein DD-endopeptidase MepM/ murein hydrolase activator NlpD
VNGALVAPERFAIDFVQLDRQRRLFTGPVGQLSGYPGYGEQVLSVAAGTVVGTHDGEPDQIPPNVPPFSLDTAGGNWVVVDIGGGHFAFYAHLQPHSLTVTAGDRVRRGQVLGLLGNSGNSTAPHLHFHIMDGPSTPVADSLPYEFADFTSSGTVTDENALFSGLPTPIGPQLAGSHHHQLPLNLQVIDFH